MTDKRRLIGIDLAWKDGNGSGCVELAWSGCGLQVKSQKTLYSLKDVIEWIDPTREGWVVAVDAPLVVCNKKGSREAEKQAGRCYGRFQANAYPASLKRPIFREGYPGRGLRDELTSETHRGRLIEQATDVSGPNLVFETYPHIAMVELFNLAITIKYKEGWISRNCDKEYRPGCRNGGQQWLAEEICEHLCSDSDRPKLLPNGKLDDLLREPESILKGKPLKDREDRLDGLICAYTAAWLDAGRDLVGLGAVGEGVMITPRVQGIGPMLE